MMEEGSCWKAEEGEDENRVASVELFRYVNTNLATYADSSRRLHCYGWFIVPVYHQNASKDETSFNVPESITSLPALQDYLFIATIYMWTSSLLSIWLLSQAVDETKYL